MKPLQWPVKNWMLFALLLFISMTIFSQPKLPSSWQPGMKLTMKYGGGMRYYSYTLEISDSGSIFTENEEGRITRYKMPLSKKELDSLLRVLHDNHFESIKTEMTGPAHDKGTETISLVWGNNYAGISEGYAQDVVEKDKGRYSTVCQYGYQLMEKTKKKGTSLPVEKEPD
jgi:hypothetical protein